MSKINPSEVKVQRLHILYKSHVQLRLAFLIILFFLSSLASVQAQQNTLQRVSVSERSDNKGQVVRFHLQQPADSFTVFQPNTDLIQLSVYGEGLDTTGVVVPRESATFDEISFYKIPGGLGIDFYLAPDRFYLARAYPDKHSSDLLMGLTRTSRASLQKQTKGREPIIWSRFMVSEESMLVGEGAAGGPTLSESGYVPPKNEFDVVVLDPGHGGYDPGSIGYQGIYEKNIVLKIAKKVGGYLKEYLPDVKVVYTRDSDEFIELEERGSIANRNEGDLFISIHCNSHSSRYAYGTDVFFLGLERSETALEVMKRENRVIQSDRDTAQKQLSPEDLLVYELTNSGYIATSEHLAGRIEHQLSDRAQRRSRGVKQARFVVLYHASMPAILVETGFISNPSEARYLSSDHGQSIIASAIFRAIRNYKEETERSQHANAK